MGAFLQRVESKDPECEADPGLTRAFLRQGLAEQGRHGRQGPLVQTPALRREPFRQERLARLVAGQQLPAVESHRLLERRPRALIEAALELGDIGHERIARDRDGLGVRHDQHVVVRSQVPAEHGQRLAQAVARLNLVTVAPEQAGELLAAVWATRLQRQVGKEQRGFTCGDQGDRRAR